MSKIIEIESAADFDDQIVNGEGKRLVKFTAPWCGPCKSMKPVDEQVSAEVDVFYINIDQDDLNATAKKFGVRGVPTYMVFENGKPDPKVLVGAKPKSELEELYK